MSSRHHFWPLRYIYSRLLLSDSLWFSLVITPDESATANWLLISGSWTLYRNRTIQSGTVYCSVNAIVESPGHWATGPLHQDDQSNQSRKITNWNFGFDSLNACAISDSWATHALENEFNWNEWYTKIFINPNTCLYHFVKMENQWHFSPNIFITY
jgi:hypothetical protein